MKSILKGVAVVESLAFAPYVLAAYITPVALAVDAYRVANFVFGMGLLWSGLTLPHIWYSLLHGGPIGASS